MGRLGFRNTSTHESSHAVEEENALNRLLASLKLRPAQADGLAHLSPPDPQSPNCPKTPQAPAPPPSYAEAIKSNGPVDQKSAAQAVEEKARELTDPTKNPDEAKLLRDALAIFRAADAVPKDLPRLEKPVLVPRMSPGPTYPFTRCWAPDLESKAIPKGEFVAILDQLNIAISPHPVITSVQYGAFAASFIPVDGADAIEIAITVMASIMAEVIARIRCARFLDALNEEYLRPRGLHVRCVNTRTMRRAVGVPEEESLMVPLSEEVLKLTAEERSMRHLEKWTARLEVDGLPEMKKVKGVVDKMAAFRVKTKIKIQNKAARSSRKRAWKKMQKGKKVKKEGRGEKFRLKHLTWLLIENIEDFERDEREVIEAIGVQMAEKQRRSVSWKKGREAKRDKEAGIDKGERCDTDKEETPPLVKRTGTQVSLGSPKMADYPELMWESMKMGLAKY